jgi:hypothetical protein
MEKESANFQQTMVLCLRLAALRAKSIKRPMQCDRVVLHTKLAPEVHWKRER